VTTGSILSLDVDSIALAPINAIVDVTISRTGLVTASNESDPDNVL
jgi:hypothetical protein